MYKNLVVVVFEKLTKPWRPPGQGRGDMGNGVEIGVKNGR
jgi:hypothetical protein